MYMIYVKYYGTPNTHKTAELAKRWTAMIKHNGDYIENL
jgi:hypothetical protein